MYHCNLSLITSQKCILKEHRLITCAVMVVLYNKCICRVYLNRKEVVALRTCYLTQWHGEKSRGDLSYPLCHDWRGKLSHLHDHGEWQGDQSHWCGSDHFEVAIASKEGICAKILVAVGVRLDDEMVPPLWHWNCLHFAIIDELKDRKIESSTHQCANYHFSYIGNKTLIG